MPTPKAGYFLKDGTRVPGTTTICSRWKESSGLIHWAWQCGVDGIDYRKARDDAGGSGTLAHHFVDQHLSGISDGEIEREGRRDAADLEMFAKAFNAYHTYRRWAQQTRITIVEREIQLISEKHRYGGTPDAIGMIDGERCLLDWKSGGVYVEALMQCAAYALLVNECFPDAPITGGFHICRFSKTDADFTHRYFQDLSEAEEQFLLFRRAYELDQKLKKRIA